KTADQVLRLLKLVDSEWFGVVVDTGYFLTADPYKEIVAVTPYAVNWQIKEYIGTKADRVKTDVKKVVGIARQGGYRGYLPIETLSLPGEEYDPRARVRQLLGEVREAVRQAG